MALFSAKHRDAPISLTAIRDSQFCGLKGRNSEAQTAELVYKRKFDFF